MPEFSTFNLGQATTAGQNIKAQRFRLDETQRGVDVRSAQESVLRGDPGAQDMFNKQFPIEAAVARATTQEQKLKLAGDIIDFAGNIASGITSQNYQNSLQRLSDAGVPVDDAPPSYEEGGDQWAQSKINEANGAEGQLKLQTERLKQKGKTKESGLIKSAVVGKMNASVANIFGGIYDPISGRISGLDKTSSKKAAAIKARAQRIFANANGTLTPDEAVNQAARDADIDIQKLESKKRTRPLPRGAKQVGTSGGKPVYEDKQGHRWIGE